MKLVIAGSSVAVVVVTLSCGAVGVGKLLRPTMAVQSSKWIDSQWLLPESACTLNCSKNPRKLDESVPEEKF